jgi:hypothetical protein
LYVGILFVFYLFIEFYTRYSAALIFLCGIMMIEFPAACSIARIFHLPLPANTAFTKQRKKAALPSAETDT